LKLFNLELKDNDPMALASEIKAIMHDIDVVGVEIGIALRTFIKALYPHILTILNHFKLVAN
jgi:hypothetical protein